MVFVDSISDLEYFHSNPDYGCYADLVLQPTDILLQAQIGTVYDVLSTPALITINVCKPDGTFIEDATDYFDWTFLFNTIGGVNYYYANVRGKYYSPGMLSNGCFVVNVIVLNASGGNYFNKWTQKYELLNPGIIPIAGVVVTVGGGDNLAALCGADSLLNTCHRNVLQFAWQSDCVDDYTGDFYQQGTVIYRNASSAGPVLFVKISNVEAVLRVLPKEIKRTISINCRTQRTDVTPKYRVQGVNTAIAFPDWKMLDIEGMLLSNHFFIDGKEYQSDGGAPFTQLGTPKNCLYRYKLEMDIQDCYQWQIFGCTPPCTPVTYYYPIFF